MATDLTAAEIAASKDNLLGFTVPVTAAAGGMLGLLFGQLVGLGPVFGILAGAMLGGALAFGICQFLERKQGRWAAIAVCVVLGAIFGGAGAAAAGLLIGAVLSWIAYWLHSDTYRKGVPPYATSGQVLWHNAFRFLCGLILFFLLTPIFIIIPLSFNADDFFTFTPEMLAFDPEGYSTRHYHTLFGDEGRPWTGLMRGLGLGIAAYVILLVHSKLLQPALLFVAAAVVGLFIAFFASGVWPWELRDVAPLSWVGWFVLGSLGALAVFFARAGSPSVALIAICAVLGLIMGKMWGIEGTEWMTPLKNSLKIAPVATMISVSLGTLAAIGLSQSHVPARRAIMAILISPMIVPLIISAAGMFFFYSRIGLQGTYWGVVMAHAVLGIPFVIITVTATLVGFDKSLTRAAANMGANPVTTFFRVQMPLILPGVISGGLFAFITSFDEVVVVLFVGSAGQQTLPWQMFTGLREQISPTILAAATVLISVSIVLLVTLEMLRRRSERLRGLSPG